MAGVTYSGTSFGTAVTLVASGYIIHGGWFGGWPGVFYIIGAISIVWFGMWCFLVYDTPTAHPRISGEELYYIQSSIGSQVSKVSFSFMYLRVSNLFFSLYRGVDWIKIIIKFVHIIHTCTLNKK